MYSKTKTPYKEFKNSFKAIVVNNSPFHKSHICISYFLFNLIRLKGVKLFNLQNALKTHYNNILAYQSPISNH